MRAFVALAGFLFGHLSFCALNGGLAGALVGFLFGLLQGESPLVALTITELLQSAFLLAVVGWLAVLMIVGLWLHYGLKNILWPSFANALLTALLTVWLLNLIQIPEASTVIGLLVGVLVGTLLCRFCPAINRRDAHG